MECLNSNLEKMFLASQLRICVGEVRETLRRLGKFLQ